MSVRIVVDDPWPFVVLVLVIVAASALVTWINR